jgi:DNA-binding GntR family transcriptional regulator
MQPNAPFHASQLKLLAPLVEEEIERQIMTGELVAGARINELQLSRRLGVSRGPVREALQGLRRAGLVDIVANRGAIVRSPSIEEALDLYDLRCALFAVMAERVAAIRSAADVAALERNLDESEAAIRAGSGEDYYRLNIGFHEVLATASAMRRAAAAYRDTVKEMHLCRRRGLLGSGENRRRSLAEHRSIVAAIRRRDEAKAFAAARLHIQSGKSRFASTVAVPAGPTGARDAGRTSRRSTKQEVM